MQKTAYILFIFSLLAASCQQQVQKGETALVREAQAFIDSCGHAYQAHWTREQERAWALLQADSGSLSPYSPWHLDDASLQKAEALAKQQAQLLPIQAQALQALLYYNSQFSTALPDSVSAQIALVQQLNKRYEEGCAWNCAEGIFKQQQSDKGREAAWSNAHTLWGQGSHTHQLASNRNALVSLSGFPNFYAYRIHAYNISDEQSAVLCQQFLRQVRPLFRELHTYMRLALARKYNKGMPDLLPAHWLADLHGWRWHLAAGLSQPLADTLAKLPGSAVQLKSEAFFKAKGFPNLPIAYYRYTPAGRARSTAFHINKAGDIRLHVGLQPNISSFSHHIASAAEAYGFQAMNNADVPIFMRQTTVPALNMAWRDLMGREAKSWLWEQYAPTDSLGNRMPEAMESLLLEALEYVPKLVFHAGVAHSYEQALYAGKLPTADANKRWWELMGRYMGVAPSNGKLDTYRTPETVALLWQPQAGAFDMAYTVPLSYQLQAQRPSSRYAQLQQSYYPGTNKPWGLLQRELNVAKVDASALMAHFAPLQAWLAKQHAGMNHTLPNWD